MKTSPVLQCIFNRRSVRKLKADTLPKEDVELMLACLEAAPNAGNLQPWSFYVVTNQAVKDELCQLSFNQEVVKQAPVVFVVCAKPEISATQYGEAGRNLFCLQDTAAAVQNLLLAAASMDYGAVWIGVIKEKEIADCLHLAQDERPVAIIPVGCANEEPCQAERVGWKKITKWIE
ncbi:MAG: nitroreductase [uncultured bacterium]|nr:MAG: nitroreductase [uncultured bacterium]HLD45236.1 nitroreductase family protein [bacterium]